MYLKNVAWLSMDYILGYIPEDRMLHNLIYYRMKLQIKHEMKDTRSFWRLKISQIHYLYWTGKPCKCFYNKILAFSNSFLHKVEIKVVIQISSDWLTVWLYKAMPFLRNKQPGLLWNSKVLYHIHYSILLVSILSQPNPVHITWVPKIIWEYCTILPS
jgi:hypothetical protein